MDTLTTKWKNLELLEQREEHVATDLLNQQINLILVCLLLFYHSYVKSVLQVQTEAPEWVAEVQQNRFTKSVGACLVSCWWLDTVLL